MALYSAASFVRATSPNLRPEVLIAMGTVAEDVPMLTGIMGQFGNYVKSAMGFSFRMYKRLPD